jgi:predicted permease
MVQDFRFALRQLAKRSSITLLAVLCLALGIGTNSAVFSYLDAMYLRPLDTPSVDRLARLFVSSEQDAYGTFSYPEYLDLRKQCPAFSGIAAAQRRGARYLHDGEETLVSIYGVSPDFFLVMGVKAKLGRVFGPAEDSGPVVVLGHSAWQKYFGGDPAIVGKTIRLSRGTTMNVTVAGVLGPGFRDLHSGGDRDMWIPPATFAALQGGDRRDYENRRSDIFEVFGRLAPEARISEAKAQVATVGSRLAREYPEVNQNRRFFALSDLEFRLNELGPTGWAILGVLLVVVAIASVNVANLMLARLEERRHEMAMRAALGASRWRVARELWAEAALLGAGGLAAGLGLGMWLMEMMPRLLVLEADFLTRSQVRLDTRVLAFTGAVALLTVGLFGILPSLLGSRTALAPGLKTVQSSGRRGLPLRYLVLAQIVASVVVLSVAGVLVESFWNARHGNIGLGRNNVLGAWDAGGNRALDRPLLERVRAIPGVREATIAFRAPLSGNGGGLAMPVTIPGHQEFVAGQAPVNIKYNTVDQRYFGMMGVRLLRGRLFSDADREGTAPVIVISDTMARRYWPGADPIGKYVRAASGKREFQIAGVVSDAPINSVGELPEPYFYACWWQQDFGLGDFAIMAETAGDPQAIAPLFRAAIKEVNPRLDHAQLFTMEELIGDRTRSYQMAAQLVAALGGLALVLTAIGLYGMLAYGVTLRRREIGIRMAIGAKRMQAAGLVMKQGTGLVAAGIAIGAPLAVAANHGVRSVLFGVSPWSVGALAAAAVVLLGVAVAASWWPSIRASRVDPMEALRYQ